MATFANPHVQACSADLLTETRQSIGRRVGVLAGLVQEESGVVVSSNPTVAIVGATGAVGQEFLELLDQRDFPVGKLKLLASARSAGKTLDWKGNTYTIEELTEDSFGDVDIALFSAGGSISKKFGPIAVDAGAVVVDNSSAFRMTDGVPLVVPEVNPEAIGDIAIGKPGIIANPNCSTIIMIVPVTPLHRAFGVERMVVSTYQAASGAGAAAMRELEQQTRDVLEGRPPTTEIFPFQYAFNLFSHNTDIGPEGYNTEEMKMVNESRKIWSTPDVRITTTCVRVPVMRAHAETINITLKEEATEEQVRELLHSAPGVTVVDDRPKNEFPTPLLATGQDNIFVGRIRKDISQMNGSGEKTRGFDLFVCGDQIRKGAALNAVQIAEKLV